MSFDRQKPYNDLPLLPPLKELETAAILKKAIGARAALAALDASNKRLPNESLLANAVILQEAKLSSEIENIVTTNDELYQSLALESVTDPNLKEVISYPKALWYGYGFIRENGFISARVLIEMMQAIKQTDGGIRKIPGTKIANPATGEIVYTPPEGEAVILEKLKNLEQYINDQKDGIDPLVKMAVLHYQFESIHPFHDGNGRTGRILNILFLVLTGLLEHPILYLSKYILENKSDYYVKLRGVTEREEWESWILYMLDAVEQTAKYTEQKIHDICSLMESTEQMIKEKAPNIYSKELVNTLFQLPYSKRKFLVDAGIVKEKTAGKYLVELERIGLLKSEKIGRERLYFHRAFFDLLRK
ncbi:MAG: Fic family protein [Candidatus Moranbacteria bacterium]|nr:Fic family protein [Candidatus Moranbacteria bacterium]